MKLNSTYIVTLILLFSLEANSQLNFAPFLAKEGESVAISKAISLGYTDPKIIIIGTTTGIYQVGSFKIDLIFELNSGKATLWSYMFVSANKPDSTKVLALISSPFPQGDKFIINEVTPEQLSGFPTPGKNPLTSNSWMNSDEAMGKLNSFSNYQTFKNSTSNMIMKIFALGIFTDYPVPDKSRAYWIASVGNEEIERFFYIDAISGEVTESTTSFENENISSYISSFPNPATNIVTINLKMDYSESLSLQLFDQNGNSIKNDYFTFLGNEKSIILNTESLNAGIYFYKITNKNNFQNGYFLIIK